MADIPADLHLRAGGTSVVLHIAQESVPQVLYWGPDLGFLSDQDLEEFAAAQVPGVVSGTADIPPVLSLLPSQNEGWLGTPGLVGSRGGRSQFSAFQPKSVDVTAISRDAAGVGGTGSDISEGADVVVDDERGDAGSTCGDPAKEGGTRVDIHCYDDEAGLVLTIRLELTSSGLLRTRATVTNDAQDGYALESLLLALPTPAAETRVLDQTGRHLRERDIQTHEFTIGSTRGPHGSRAGTPNRPFTAPASRARAGSTDWSTTFTSRGRAIREALPSETSSDSKAFWAAKCCIPGRSRWITARAIPAHGSSGPGDMASTKRQDAFTSIYAGFLRIPEAFVR